MKTLYLFFFLTLLPFINYSQTKSEEDKMYEKAEQLFQEKQPYLALQQLNRLLEVNPKHVDAHLLKGLYYKIHRNYNVAILTYRNASKELPERYEFQILYGDILQETQNYELALKVFTKVIQNSKDKKIRNAAFSSRALVKRDLMQYEEAYNDFIKLYQEFPEDIGNLNNLATTSVLVGKEKEGIKYIKLALKLEPDYYPSYTNLGYVLQKNGKHKQAIKYLTKAIELTKQEPVANAYAHSNRAFSKYHLKQYESALVDTDISISIEPSNSYVFWVRGMILIALNKKQEACKSLDQAEKLGYSTNYGNDVIELIQKHCN